MDIPKMVRELRGEKTQEQYALELGCSRQSIVWWETGRFTPSKEWLAKLGITLHAQFSSHPERTVELER